MNYAKKPYVEFVLTITKAPKVYKKDIEFAKELKRVSMLFLKDRFTSDICNIDIHLDQSTPHLHVMSRYIGNNSLQKDLDKNYSKKRYQYSDMQTDFNQFVKDNFNFKKFPKLHIEDITKGGKRDYLPLSEFKALNSEITTNVKDEIKKILKNVKKSSSIFGDEKVSFKDYRSLAIKYGKIKIKYLFLRHLTDKTDKRNILDDLKKENDNLKKTQRINLQTDTKEKQELNSKLNSIKLELDQTNRKITLKDETISKLQKKLSTFKNSKFQKNIDR
jgi:hypothetical protein